MTKSYYQKTEEKKQQTQTQKQYFSRFHDCKFWIWDREEHTQRYKATNKKCCFNHIIGLPKKHGQPKPLFDYEKEIYDALQSTKHVWIKKARGLGVSEFTLRYIAWKCLCNDDDEWRGKNVCIVTGPRIDLAITLIKRFKALFPSIIFDDKETVCTLNNVRIEAFPSHNLDSMRGLTDVCFILLDEGDFFPVGQQKDVREVAEGYIAKTGPHIVMVSTPNQPEGLFETIEKLPADQCLYHRMIMTYEVGLNKIYTPEEIAAARASPSFPREYEGQYIGQEGNVFSHESLQSATAAGLEMEKEIPYHIVRQGIPKIMGVDGGWGSSKFGICIVQLTPYNKLKKLEQKFHVLCAEEYERPDYNFIVNHVLKLKEFYAIEKIYVDGANPEVVRPIKQGLNERIDYEKQIANLKLRHPKYLDLSKFMHIVPVSFRENGREMLGWTKQCLDNGWVAIHPDFHKLLVSLRTAQATDSLLSKSEMSHNDIFDAFRMCLWHWKKKY